MSLYFRTAIDWLGMYTLRDAAQHRSQKKKMEEVQKSIQEKKQAEVEKVIDEMK